MHIVSLCRRLSIGRRLREPAATSALLVGGLVAAVAVALPAAAGPGSPSGSEGPDAVPAATGTTTTRTIAPTSASTTSTTGSGAITTSTARPLPCTYDPITVKEVGTTWVSFARPNPNMCWNTGYYVAIYSTKTDAEARTNIVGATKALGSVSAVVSGLKPGRKYYFVTSDRSDVQGPFRTPKKTTDYPSCTATYTIINSWSGGYVAEVSVTAAKTSPVGNWTVRWTLPDGEGLDRAWGANTSLDEKRPSTPSSTSFTPGTVVSAYNSMPDVGLSAGETTRFAFLGTSSGTPVVPELTCTGTK
jgi:hypothetical protein